MSHGPFDIPAFLVRYNIVRGCSRGVFVGKITEEMGASELGDELDKDKPYNDTTYDSSYV
jgi:hypothetical protein